jgi:BRCA1-associated protein
MRSSSGKLPPGVKGPAFTPSSKKLKAADRDQLSLQPLVGHYTAPRPLGGEPHAQGVSHVGHGLIHLFKHAPPAGGVDAELEVPVPERAEGADGSLIAILAVPAWMRPSDFLEFLGGWAVCLEGVRMIR